MLHLCCTAKLLGAGHPPEGWQFDSQLLPLMGVMAVCEIGKSQHMVAVTVKCWVWSIWVEKSYINTEFGDGGSRKRILIFGHHQAVSMFPGFCYGKLLCRHMYCDMIWQWYQSPDWSLSKKITNSLKTMFRLQTVWNGQLPQVLCVTSMYVSDSITAD